MKKLLIALCLLLPNIALASTINNPLPAQTTAVTKALGDNSTAIATTAFVQGVPYFMAIRSSNQSFTSPAKVLFDTVVYDPYSYWDATNHRWTPQVPGTYRVDEVIAFEGTNTVGLFNGCTIEKNGAAVNFTFFYPPAQTAQDDGSCVVPAYVAMNGTTDYIEAWVSTSITSSNIVGGTAPYTSYFMAQRISK